MKYKIDDWEDFDRDHEPCFKDYTYLKYKGDIIYTFSQVLKYSLSKYLNKNFIKLINIDDIIKAYCEFNAEPILINNQINQKIKLLKDKQSRLIDKLGNNIAKGVLNDSRRNK
jgi:hypothetical protein